MFHNCSPIIPQLFDDCCNLAFSTKNNGFPPFQHCSSGGRVRDRRTSENLEPWNSQLDLEYKIWKAPFQLLQRVERGFHIFSATSPAASARSELVFSVFFGFRPPYSNKGLIGHRKSKEIHRKSHGNLSENVRKSKGNLEGNRRLFIRRGLWVLGL